MFHENGSVSACVTDVFADGQTYAALSETLAGRARIRSRSYESKLRKGWFLLNNKNNLNTFGHYNVGSFQQRNKINQNLGSAT
jgi:hypothetical protein